MPRTQLPRSLGWLAVLLAALTPFASHAAPAANLLANPGFEESLSDHPWMPAGWDTARAGLTSVFYGRDTVAAHSGNYSVSVANASGLIPISPNWSQTLSVGPEFWGKDLVLTVWTRTMGLDGRAYVKIDAYRDTIGKMAAAWNMDRASAGSRLKIAPIDDPILDLGWKREFFSDPETGWVRRQLRMFVAPSVNMVYVRCGIMGTGQLMIDDASLTLEPAQPVQDPPLQTNLLANPGFEQDDNAWEYSLPPYIDMRAERDSSVSHSGKASFAILSPEAGMVAGKTGASQVFDGRLLAGKRVRFTGWIRCKDLKSEAFLKIFSHGLSGVTQDVSVANCSGTEDWMQSSVEMDIPDDAYDVWAWFGYTAPAPGRVWFDDASLVVVGKATAAKR